MKRFVSLLSTWGWIRLLAGCGWIWLGGVMYGYAKCPEPVTNPSFEIVERGTWTCLVRVGHLDRACIKTERSEDYDTDTQRD